MKRYALIPARGGSKGLPGKNIKLLNGLPLIAHSILTAIDSSIFEKIVVSTDDHKIAAVANNYGAEVFMRSAEYASDLSHMFPIYKEFLSSANYINPFDQLFVLLPTNPLRTTRDIVIASTLFEDPEVEWVFSCNEMEHHPYRSVRICQQTGQMTPFFPLSNEVMWSNRQELPAAFRFNGAIIAGQADSILRNSEYPIDSFNYMSTNVKAFLSSKYSSLDIDTQQDFDYIEYLLAHILSK